MATTEQMVKEKPELVQAYVTASLAGWKSFADKPEPIISFVKEYNKDYDVELGLVAAEIEKPLLTGKSWDPKMMGLINEQRFKELHDQMREVGVLKQDQDVKKAFDARFIDAAQKA